MTTKKDIIEKLDAIQQTLSDLGKNLEEACEKSQAEIKEEIGELRDMYQGLADELEEMNNRLKDVEEGEYNPNLDEDD